MSEPTAAAMRAARVDIANLIGGMRKLGMKVGDPPEQMIVLSASIIDRETGLPELLEAAKLGLRIAESWTHDQLDGTGSLEDALRELEPIRAAIAKAEGK